MLHSFVVYAKSPYANSREKGKGNKENLILKMRKKSGSETKTIHNPHLTCLSLFLSFRFIFVTFISFPFPISIPKFRNEMKRKKIYKHHYFTGFFSLLFLLRFISFRFVLFATTLLFPPHRAEFQFPVARQQSAPPARPHPQHLLKCVLIRN